MTAAALESPRWSRGRWWGLVALIFGVQLALIFWLGETSPIRPRPAAPAFTFKLAGPASAELLALDNPALFVLPEPQKSTDQALVKPLTPEIPSFPWPEPTNSLLLGVDQLGAAFNRLIETNEYRSPQLPISPSPALTLPDLPPPEVAPEQATVRLEWDSAQRRLLTPLALRSWPSADILTDSVVQIVVDADGRPESAILLSGSGSGAADQYALEQARAARFAPVPRDPAGTAPLAAGPLSWGRMIFQWNTLPLAPTNAPAVVP